MELQTMVEALQREMDGNDVKVMDVIGAGGFGVVYRGEWLRGERMGWEGGSLYGKPSLGIFPMVLTSVAVDQI